MLTNQYAEGYWSPLLRRLRFVDVIGDPRDRARQEPLRRRIRERAAAPLEVRAPTPRCWPRSRNRRPHPPVAGNRERQCTLTHGMKALNFSGKLYEAHAYGVDESGRVDMDDVRAGARGEARRADRRVVGVPAFVNFARFREIADEVGDPVEVDMAHFAGLVAAGLHPSRCRTRMSRRRRCTRRSADRARASSSPTTRGSGEEDQLERVPRPAGRAAHARDRGEGDRVQARGDARVQGPAGRTKRGAAILASRLTADDAKAAGIDVLTGGTDVHLAVLVDLRTSSSRAKTRRTGCT